MKNILTLAAVGLLPLPGAASLLPARLEGYVRAAARRGADLMLFPALPLKKEEKENLPALAQTQGIAIALGSALYTPPGQDFGPAVFLAKEADLPGEKMDSHRKKEACLWLLSGDVSPPPAAGSLVPELERCADEQGVPIAYAGSLGSAILGPDEDSTVTYFAGRLPGGGPELVMATLALFRAQEEAL